MTRIIAALVFLFGIAFPIIVLLVLFWQFLIVRTDQRSLAPVRRCGGKLEFRQTVGSRENRGTDVHFFQCKDCGHIDTRDNNERSAP